MNFFPLHSLSAVEQVLFVLVDVAPFLQPYIETMEKSVRHVFDNYHLVWDYQSRQELIKEAAMIFLTSPNITTWGNPSGVNVTTIPDIINETIQLIINMKIFGEDPMLYQTLQQFLASNSTSMIVQQVAEISVWLTSTERTGLDLQVLPKTYEILRPLVSILTRMITGVQADAELIEDLLGNTVAMLTQLLNTSGILPPMNQNLSVYQTGMMGHSNSFGVRRKRAAPLIMARDPMDDFIDLFDINYPAMFVALSVPPTTEEIRETAHVFFANPDLNVVIKGATSGMPWGMNASREDTIDAALGLLSFLTLPGMFQT